MTGRCLAELAWPEVVALLEGDPRLLAVPLGAVEQHGPHLPVDTDCRVATALAGGLAGRRSDVVVAPCLPYGSSGEHAGFPGTLSIGREALARVVVELVRSAGCFSGVVLVSGHGGNAAALAGAAARLEAEGRPVVAWWPRAAGGVDGGETAGCAPEDAHAGRTETSVMLALDPQAVSMERAVRGETRPLAAISARLRSAGVASVSPSGVLGDPAGASAGEGRAWLAAWGSSLAAAVGARWPEGPS